MLHNSIFLIGFAVAVLAAVSGAVAEVGVWAVYFAGQMIHTALKADTTATARRKAGQAYTAGQYWRDNRWPIAGRKFLGACIFLLVWDNPSLVNLTAEASKVGFRTLIAVAGIIGYFSDSLLDKAIAKVMAKFGAADANAQAPKDKE